MATTKVTRSVITSDAISGSEIADDAIDSEHYAAGSIDEAHIADNAVTLAKMAGGTDGNIISYDASGNPVAIATGNDGQVLTSTGAGSPPAFEDAAGGGAWTLIETQNVTTGVSSVDFDSGIDSTYDTYKLIISGMHSVNDGVDIYLRYSNDGGSTYETLVYEYHETQTKSTSTSYSALASTSASFIFIGELRDQASGGYNGEITLFEPSNSSKYTCVSWVCMQSEQEPWNHSGVANRQVTEVTNALRIVLSSGNIDDGRFSLYGISHT